MRLIKKNSTYFFTSIVIAMVVFLHLSAGKLILTGDEPRYLFAGVSAWTQGNFLMSQALWNEWLIAHGIGIHYGADRGVHSVTHSLFLAPLSANFGLEAARWAQLLFVIPITGLYWKHGPVKSRFAFGVWTLLYFASVPVLPYLKLIYPEAWILALFSIVVIFTSLENKTPVQKYMLLIALIALPFIHLRTVLAALIFGLYFLYNEWNEKPRDTKKIRNMSLLVIFFMLIFGWYQLTLSGSFIGTAHPTYSPKISNFFDRISAQIFGYRHGIFFNNPMSLIGLAGLILGTLKRNKFISVCLISLFVYLITIIWTSASESYSARFWVFVMPLFIYGSYYWLSEVSSKFKWVVVIILVGLTLFNTTLFTLNPNYYLENRFGSVGYEFLYEYFGHIINLNLIAASDSYDGGLTIFNPDNNLYILLLLIAFVVGLAGMGFTYRRKINVSIAIVIIVFSTAIYQSYMVIIPQDEYKMTYGIDVLGRSYINFTFQKEVRVHGLRFGKYLDRPLWGIGDAAPRQFMINGRTAAGDIIAEQRIPGAQLVRFITSEKLLNLSVISYSPEFIKQLDISSISVF